MNCSVKVTPSSNCGYWLRKTAYIAEEEQSKIGKLIPYKRPKSAKHKQMQKACEVTEN